MKPIWQSKTFWVNALALIAGVGTIFGFDLTPELQATIVTAIVSVMPIVNIILRSVTKDEVTVLGGPPNGPIKP